MHAAKPTLNFELSVPPPPNFDPQAIRPNSYIFYLPVASVNAQEIFGSRIDHADDPECVAKHLSQILNRDVTYSPVFDRKGEALDEAYVMALRKQDIAGTEEKPTGSVDFPGDIQHALFRLRQDMQNAQQGSNVTFTLPAYVPFNAPAGDKSEIASLGFPCERWLEQCGTLHAKIVNGAKGDKIVGFRLPRTLTDNYSPEFLRKHLAEAAQTYLPATGLTLDIMKAQGDSGKIEWFLGYKTSLPNPNRVTNNLVIDAMRPELEALRETAQRQGWKLNANAILPPVPLALAPETAFRA